MPGMKDIAKSGPVSRAYSAKGGMKKMATGGTTSRPTGIANAMKRVEKSGADRALDRLAGIKEGSAKDVRADKMQAKNLMAGKPQVDKAVKAAYGVKKMATGGTTSRPTGIANAMQHVAKSGSSRATEALSGVKKMARGGTMKRGK